MARHHVVQPVPRRVLPVLVLAQFAGTSMWFAVNAVMPDLQREFGWPETAVGNLTSALQIGFIIGTLVFALLAIADRFSPKRVFLFCSLAGGACTLGAWSMVSEFSALLIWRAATGFFLAGIYPVGMKIASQWYTRGLGAALGLLIGALVLGSASSHGLRAVSSDLPWPSVMLGVALLAAAGGVLLYACMPEPPREATDTLANTFEWRALAVLWTNPRVRASVLGYFGHQWELYTMWVLVPFILATRLEGTPLSLAAFCIIGSGAIGCVVGGMLVRRFGSARVAGVQLATSGLCCVLAPWLMGAGAMWFGLWLLVWGITVSGDSPQFSTLTANNAPRHVVGSVLTLANSMGFAISVVSIELFVELLKTHSLTSVLPWLGLGPLLGLWGLRVLLREGA